MIIVNLSRNSVKQTKVLFPTNYMNIEQELTGIQEQVNALNAQYPDFQLYITVSKDFNEALAKHLGTEDYSIRLEELYGCRYQVSPFVDKYLWVVGLFDYSQILGQWNTFQDKVYKLSHLFTYVTNDAEEKDGDTWGSEDTSN